MSLPVLLRHEASRDVEDTRDYFEHLKVGLGQSFIHRLKESLCQIGAMPELYGIVWRNVRAARLKRSSFVLYYRVHTDRVEVLAVVHSSRDSSAWQSRA